MYFTYNDTLPVKHLPAQILLVATQLLLHYLNFINA